MVSSVYLAKRVCPCLFTSSRNLIAMAAPPVYAALLGRAGKADGSRGPVDLSLPPPPARVGMPTAAEARALLRALLRTAHSIKDYNVRE